MEAAYTPPSAACSRPTEQEVSVARTRVASSFPTGLYLRPTKGGIACGVGVPERWGLDVDSLFAMEARLMKRHPPRRYLFMSLGLTRS